MLPTPQRSDFAPRLRELFAWVFGARTQYKVSGHSMEPLFSGDDDNRVLVRSYHNNETPRVNDVVVFRHPIQPLLLVKCISTLENGRYTVHGLAAGHTTDSDDFGSISLDSILGKVTVIF